MVKSSAVLLILTLALGMVGTQNPVLALPSALTAQDGRGTIWGAGEQEGGTIFRWHEAGGWRAYDLPETKGLTPSNIILGDDGAVYVLWQPPYPSSDDILITTHRGSASRVLARFPSAATNYPQPGDMHLWAGVSGDVWVAGRATILRRISPAGVMKTYPILPEQIRGKPFPPGSSPCVPNGSVVDAQGKRWFWQGSPYIFGSSSTLRGVLIWDGRQMSYHATLPGLPDQPILLIEKLDDTRLWVALSGPYWTEHAPPMPGGLYHLDINSLTAKSEPTIKAPFGIGMGLMQTALQSVSRIFRSHDVWYAFDNPLSGSGNASLWRRRGNLWVKCGIQLRLINPQQVYLEHCPLLEIPGGAWLGIGDCTLYVPARTGEPVLVDWRRGLELAFVSNFYSLTSGRILATGSGGAVTAFLPPSLSPLLPLPQGFSREGNTVRQGVFTAVSDPRKHLWVTHNSWNGSFPLDEWDGTRWHFHLAPGLDPRFSWSNQKEPQVRGLIASDTLGRLWFSNQKWDANGPGIEGITIYDPAHDKWFTHTSKTEALQAVAALPGVTLEPVHNVPLSIALSGDGRAVIAEVRSLKLYDGHLWHELSANEIVKGTQAEKYGDQYFSDMPVFQSSGSLQISANGGRMEMSPLGAWRLLAPAPYHSPDPYPSGGPPQLYSYPYLYNSQPLPTDSNGALWISLGDRIYTHRYDLWTSHLSLNEAGSPFRDGRPIEQVFTDPQGRLFFMTRLYGRLELVSWMPPAPVKITAPTIRIIPRDFESVKLTFAVSQPSKNKLRWRLNDGEWKEAKTTIFTELPLGDYRVEAQLIDASLQSASPVASAAFTIRPAAPQQITTWVQTLILGDDPARNRAAVLLVKQGDKSLTTLKAARPGASEVGQWWIDSVTQQIEAVKTSAEPGL